jgi:hypothetical protein
VFMYSFSCSTTRRARSASSPSTTSVELILAPPGRRFGLFAGF